LKNKSVSKHPDIEEQEDAIEFSRNGAFSFIALNGENYLAQI
jgi:hypothetical protein